MKKRLSESLKNSYISGKRKPWNKGLAPWNKGLTAKDDPRLKKASQTLKNGYSSGRLSPTFKGKSHAEEFRQKQRQNALKRGLGGFHMRRGIDYKGIKLDSTYEIKVAESLDDNGIRWERPGRFTYHFNGKIRHYTPDFYLPDFNVYLDPKNDFLINNVNPRLGIKDVDKIHQVEIENNIKILILNKEQLSWQCIQQLLISRRLQQLIIRSKRNTAIGYGTKSVLAYL